MNPFLALLLSVALAADESPPPPAGFQPVQLDMEHRRCNLPIGPGVPGWSEEFRASYLGNRFAVDRLDYQLVLVGQSRILERADLKGGPDGRVLIDTSRSTDPRMAFRGIIRAATATMQVQPRETGQPVRWLVEFREVQDFHGMINANGQPRQIVGWAQRMVAEVLADVQGGDLVRARLSALHLYAQADAPQRKAVVILMKEPVPDAQALAQPLLDAKTYGYFRKGALLTTTFDDAGNATFSGEYIEEGGFLDFITPGTPRSAPAILPGK